MLYKTVYGIIKVVLKLLFRVKYIGEENFPEEGGYILCSNHVSGWDPLFLACSKTRECSFIAKAELLENKFIRLLSKKFNIYPIKRGTGDIGAIKKAISLIDEGNVLIMFPEGTRSKDGKLGEGKSGVSLIAKKTGCLLIPCAVNGKPKLFRQTKVIFGKPFRLNEVKTSDELNSETKRLMGEISKLLEEVNEKG